MSLRNQLRRATGLLTALALMSSSLSAQKIRLPTMSFATSQRFNMEALAVRALISAHQVEEPRRFRRAALIRAAPRLIQTPSNYVLPVLGVGAIALLGAIVWITPAYWIHISLFATIFAVTWLSCGSDTHNLGSQTTAIFSPSLIATVRAKVRMIFFVGPASRIQNALVQDVQQALNRSIGEQEGYMVLNVNRLFGDITELAQKRIGKRAPLESMQDHPLYSFLSLAPLPELSAREFSTALSCAIVAHALTLDLFREAQGIILYSFPKLQSSLEEVITRMPSDALYIVPTQESKHPKAVTLNLASPSDPENYRNHYRQSALVKLVRALEEHFELRKPVTLEPILWPAETAERIREKIHSIAIIGNPGDGAELLARGIQDRFNAHDPQHPYEILDIEEILAPITATLNQPNAPPLPAPYENLRTWLLAHFQPVQIYSHSSSVRMAAMTEVLQWDAYRNAAGIIVLNFPNSSEEFAAYRGGTLSRTHRLDLVVHLTDSADSKVRFAEFIEHHPTARAGNFNRLNNWQQKLPAFLKENDVLIKVTAWQPADQEAARIDRITRMENDFARQLQVKTAAFVDAADTLRWRINVLFGNDKPREGLELAAVHLKAHPADARIIQLFCTGLLMLDEIKKAITVGRHLVSLEPQNAEAHLLLAKCYAADGQHDMAIDEAENANTPLALELIAQEARALQKWRLVIETLRKLQELQPKNVKLISQEAYAQLKNGDLLAARAVCEKGLSLFPENPLLLDTSTKIYMARHDLASALKTARLAAVIHPNSDLTLRTLGIVELANRNPYAAIAAVDQIPAGPSSAAARDIVAKAMARLGRIDDAIQIQADVVGRNPLNGLSHYNLGLLYAQSEDYPLAIEEFRSAIRLEPNRSHHRTALIRALIKNRNYSAALEESFRAMTDFHGHEVFQNIYDDLLRSSTEHHSLSAAS